MKFIPDSLSRISYRSILKIKAGSPTILVISGVIGLGATAVMAAKATRRIDPILDAHKQTRGEIGYIGKNRGLQKELMWLYLDTGSKLGKLYGGALFVGSCSAVSVIGGHNILRHRQIATMAAYSGLLEQFGAYRKRVAKTLTDDVEKGIYEGARGEMEEDPDNPGEYRLVPKFDLDKSQSYLRPWFDETNWNFTRDPVSNYLFLKGVQQHMNNLLRVRGHVFLNEAYDALGMERCKEGAIAGWVWNSATGDNLVDFGFMSSIDPHTVAFRNGAEKTVRLNFNIDGTIWDLI